MEIILNDIGIKTPEDLKKKINSLPDSYQELIDELTYVYHRFKRYREAVELFSTSKGKQTLEAIKGILQKHLEDFEINYAMEYDYEDPIKTPFVYAHLKKKYPNDFLEKIEEEIIEDVVFKHEVDVIVVLITPKGEVVATSSV